MIKKAQLYIHKHNSKGFGTLEGMLIVVVIVLLAIAGYIVYRNHLKTAGSTAPATTNSTTKTTAPTSTDLTYTSKVGGFTISYPKSWTIVGYTGQFNTTKVPASQMDGTESTALLTSSGAKSDSFGVWLTVGSSSNPTSSLNSAFTQIPYAQGSIFKNLSNGVAVWGANQSLTINGHTNPDTCTPFETVSNGAFGFKLNNGKYLDASMSFCYAQRQTTTKSYSEQASSTELQQGVDIISSLKQN